MDEKILIKTFTKKRLVQNNTKPYLINAACFKQSLLLVTERFYFFT